MLLALRHGFRSVRSAPGRSSRYRLRTQPKFVILLRHQHKNARDIHLHNENNGQDSLGGRILQFIRDETKYLSESMKIDESLNENPQISPDKIDPALSSQIAALPDIHEQFATLLRSPKFAVHPDVLLQFYSLLPVVDEPERQLLLRRLVFHRQWHQFWQTAITDATSLSDVEDLVELIHAELQASNNNLFGVWEAIRAAVHQTTTSGLLNSILEGIEFKFGFSKTQISNFVAYIRELDNVETQEELELLEESQRDALSNNMIHKAFYIQARLRFDNCVSVEKDPCFLKSPGWYSFLTSSIPQRIHYLAYGSETEAETPSSAQKPALMSYFLHHRSAYLNENDLFSLFQSATPQDAKRIYLLAYKNSQRNLVSSRRIFNHILSLAKLHKDDKLVLEVFEKFLKYLSPQICESLLPLIVVNNPRLLRSFERKRPDSFNNSVLNFVRSGVSAQKLASVIAYCNNRRRAIRLALKAASLDAIEAQEVVRYLLNGKLTAYNLLEVLRFAFRYELLNESTCQLVDEILKKTWNANKLIKRGQARSYQFKDDFRFYYAMSSKEERFRLTKTIVTLGQAMSVLDTRKLAEFYKLLRYYIFHSSKFTFVTSNTGKTYLMDRLIKYTMHFIYKSQGDSQEKDGVKKIRDVLNSLNFNTNSGQSSLLEFIVYEEPKIAHEILKKYQSRKSAFSSSMMEGVFRGVLRSRSLSPLQRVLAFDNLRNIAKTMGYRHEMSARLVVLYGNSIMSCLRQDERKTADLLKEVIQMGHSRGVPLSVIKGWSKSKA
ncbi:hypothetical_protein [Candidozyma auris]|uniref:hypothetical_protein n=1 Tax=Candidozyma auris TaxID=498019 RepID=UPI000D2D86CB|nr:hypothetical_protein [[Candida] auris]QEO20381.1 hypothetical_protein [[Candida] auris]